MTVSTAMTDAIFGDAETRALLDGPAMVRAMVRVEIALAQAQADLGLVPDAAASEIAGLERVEITPDALAAGVARSGVPIPALVERLRAALSPEAADHLHFGATSQDIVDSAFALCAGQALDHLAARLAPLLDALEALAHAEAETLILARTRGQVATPIAFGLRVAQWAQPLIALEADLPALRKAALRVQLGGASGSRSALGAQGAEVAAALAAALGLEAAPPWHTDRDGQRRLAQWLSRLVAAMARIGRDVALSARTEVGEVRLRGSGSSSTMPHKSNPVLAEALQSLAPMAVACEAGLAASAVHAEERDGVNWPVEWVLLPQAFELAGAALSQCGRLLDAMEVNRDAMRARIDMHPSVRAEAAVFALADLVGRVEASRIVAAALAQDRPLADALRVAGLADPGAALSDRSFLDPAQAVIVEIFAARPG